MCIGHPLIIISSFSLKNESSLFVRRIIVMGDFKDKFIGHDKLDVFCDTLNLNNLVKSETCYTNKEN